MTNFDKFLQENGILGDALTGAGIGSAAGGLSHLFQGGDMFRKATAPERGSELTSDFLKSSGKGAFYGLLAGLSIGAAQKIVDYFRNRDNEAKVSQESVEELPDNVVEELNKLGLEDKFYESDVWNEAEIYIKDILDNPQKIEAAGVKPEVVIAAFVKVAYNNWLEGKKNLQEAKEPDKDDDDNEDDSSEVPIDLKKIKSILSGRNSDDDDGDGEESLEKRGDDYLNGIKSVKMVLIKKLDQDASEEPEDAAEHIAGNPLVISDILGKALHHGMEPEGHHHGMGCLIKKMLGSTHTNVEPHGIPTIIVLKNKLDQDEADF